MQTEWFQEMQKQIVSLATEALKAADAPLDMREGLMGLVIQRAVVFGHQECMRRLREQGVLNPHDTVPAMRAVVEKKPHRRDCTAEWCDIGCEAAEQLAADVRQRVSESFIEGKRAVGGAT